MAQNNAKGKVRVNYHNLQVVQDEFMLVIGVSYHILPIIKNEGIFP